MTTPSLHPIEGVGEQSGHKQQKKAQALGAPKEAEDDDEVGKGRLTHDPDWRFNFIVPCKGHHEVFINGNVKCAHEERGTWIWHKRRGTHSAATGS